MALLLEGRPREASVRAVTFCNMYSFSKDSLDYLLRLYPEVSEATLTLTLLPLLSPVPNPNPNHSPTPYPILTPP